MKRTLAEAATIDLNLVVAFVRVVETGSFTAAARALRLPTSSVSRRVTHLEQELAARLIQRTTRKLRLTAIGQAYYEQARAALAGLDEANAVVAEQRQSPRGVVRM